MLSNIFDPDITNLSELVSGKAHVYIIDITEHLPHISKFWGYLLAKEKQQANSYYSPTLTTH